jgi:hypothetical protein
MHAQSETARTGMPATLLLLLLPGALASNPLVPGIGMADPHMHVFPSDPNRV